MAALPYMQLYVADYLADTAHLTAAQHGAYLLLIFNYWQRGKPLNNASERLTNVARMTSEEWAEAKPILSEFFEIDGDEWKHERIERDLEAVNSKSNKASAAGKASAARKANERPTDVKRTFNHTDVDTDTDTEKSKPTLKPESASPSGFAEFWSSYPKKKSKGDAEKVWKRIKPDLKTVLQAIERAKTSADWLKEQGQFIPHPATWLNAKGWEDEITTATQSSVSGAKPWFLSSAGIEQHAASIGIEKQDGEVFPYFKQRVYQAAGVTEEMLRGAQADFGGRA